MEYKREGRLSLNLEFGKKRVQKNWRRNFQGQYVRLGGKQKNIADVSVIYISPLLFQKPHMIG